MSLPYIEVAVGILIDDTKNILIAKRPFEKYGGGLWEFPGGKIESFETPHQTLLRELWEELGVKIDLNHSTFLGNTEYRYPEFIFQGHVFIVRYWRGAPQPLASQKLLWTQQADLRRHSFLPGCAKIIDLLETKTELIDRPQNLNSSFGLEHPLLKPLTPAVTPQITIVTDNTVTGNDKR